jgi:hypothetical protein
MGNWTAAEEFNNTNRTAIVDAHWGELKKNVLVLSLQLKH